MSEEGLAIQGPGMLAGLIMHYNCNCMTWILLEPKFSLNYFCIIFHPLCEQMLGNTVGYSGVYQLTIHGEQMAGELVITHHNRYE